MFIDPLSPRSKFRLNLIKGVAGKAGFVHTKRVTGQEIHEKLLNI
jgi:hypothetical protein